MGPSAQRPCPCYARACPILCSATVILLSAAAAARATLILPLSPQPREHVHGVLTDWLYQGRMYVWQRLVDIGTSNKAVRVIWTLTLLILTLTLILFAAAAA